MPFIVPLILGAALVAEIGVVGVAVIEIAVTVALSFGLSYLAKALAPKTPSAPASLGGVQTQVQFGANLPRSALFGMQATAGALLYWNADGANNDNLQLVYAIGDGLHDSLAGMYINGLPVTVESSPVSLSWGSGYPVTEYRTGGVIGGTPRMLVRFFNGSDSQAADSELVSHANPAGRWSSNNTLTGICYASITLLYDTNVYSSGSIPQFLFVVKGLRCYDVRKDSAVGGSGSHRWGTQSTYEWTANPAIGLYNYQRGVWVNGNLMLGMGLSTNDMVQNAYVAAANSCDDAITLVLGGASISSINAGGTGHAVGDVITLAGGTFTVPILVRVDTILSGVITHATIIQSGHFTVSAGNPVSEGSTSGFGINAKLNLTWTSTESRYRVGMQVASNVQHRDAITAFLSSMAGTLLEDAGIFAPLAGVAQTVALSFTDSDLVAGQSQVYSSHRSRADLINAVFGTYSEPVQNWASISSPPRVSSADATEDGEELATSIDFPMIYSGTQAQRVEEITRKLARLQATATIVLPFKFSVLEPGDWVTWTSARFGFTKTFLISITTLNPDQTITLTLREIASSAFDWTANTDELSGTAPTNLAGFNSLATTVNAFSIVAAQINASGGVTTPALSCNWTAITDATIKAVIVQYRIQSDTNVLEQRFADPTTGLGLISSGIQSAAVYEARATIETIPSRAATYTAWVNTGVAVGNQVVAGSLGSTPPVGSVGRSALTDALNTELNDAIASVQDQAAQLFATGVDIGTVAANVNANNGNIVTALASAATAEFDAAAANANATTASIAAASAKAEADASQANIILDLVALATITDAFSGFQFDTTSHFASSDATLAITGTTAANALAATVTLTTNLSSTNTNVTANSAAISSEAATRASADTTIAGTVTSLTSTVSGNTAAISSEASTRASADTTIAGTVTALTTAVGTNTAAISSEATTRAGADTTIAGTVTALTSTVGTNASTASAAVSSEAGTRASADTALSSSISTVSAAVALVNAGAQFQVIASAGSGGALALIDMQVNASVGATFASAGIQIAAYTDIYGVPYSRLRLYGDLTEIGIPGITGGDFFAPFLVEQVNGLPQIALRPDAIPDGAIGSRALDDGALGKISHATSSDVTKTSVSWNNSGAGNTVITTTINVVVGSTIFIDFNTMWSYNDIDAGGPDTSAGFVKILVNGTVVKTYPYAPITSDPNIPSPYLMRTVVNNLPGGSTTIAVLMQITSTRTNTITAKTPEIYTHELANPIFANTSLTPSVSYQTSVVGSGTFTSTAIGSANTNRVVVVALRYYNSGNTPTLTIGGVAANRVAFVGDTWGTGMRSALFECPYPTGTMATIIASIAGSPVDISISVWAVVASSHVPVYCGGGGNNSGSYYAFGGGNMSMAPGQVYICSAYGGYVDGSNHFDEIWNGSATLNKRVDITTGTGQRYAVWDMVSTQTINATMTVEDQTTNGHLSPLVSVFGTWQ